MTLTLIAGPIAAPVSIGEMLAQCRLDNEDERALLAGFIRAAADFVEEHSGRRLITQTWAWTVDAFSQFWDGYLRLPLVPVQSITSITYADPGGVQQLLSPIDYAFRGERITLAPNANWPSVWPGYDVVTVTFVAGYGDSWNSVPESLRQAVQMLAAYWFAQREAAAIGPDYGPVSDVPFSVKAILEPFKFGQCEAKITAFT